MKIFGLIISLFFIITGAAAQNFPYGKASQEEIEMQKYDKDTSANAVVLNEYGKSRIIETSGNNLRLEFEYHVKIKIFNHNGFSSGNVFIPLTNNTDKSLTDEVNNITGITTYKDENGNIQVTELDPKKTFTTRDYKYQSTLKFAMPGMRDGCVIEYQYIVLTPFFEYFRPWVFQGRVPKMYSEYDADIPGFWRYNISLRGPLKLSKSKSDIENNCISIGANNAGCVKLAYAMTDIPAFITEEYMTAPKNFLAALNFEPIEFTNPYTGIKRKITADWKDVDGQLKSNDDFGRQLKKSDLVKGILPPAILGIADSTAKAMAIFDWVKGYFKWNGYTGIYSPDGIKKAIETHSGGVSDINITLINALNAAGLEAEAILLSTRDHGVINTLYPVMGDFNYVTARVTIGGKGYFLDATDPLLPFGMLDAKCLNGQARAFTLDKPSYWTDVDVKQVKANTYSLDLTLQDDGKLKGTLIHYSLGYEAYLKRKRIKKFNSADEYFEDLGNRSSKVKLVHSTVQNLDSLNLPLVEQYDLEINLAGKNPGRSVAFNPFFWDRITSNPFKLAERLYPVDMEMPLETRLTLTVHIPSGYVVTQSPENKGITIPNGGGKFIVACQPGQNEFTYSHLLELDKAIYNTEEYPYLKEFYNKVIQSEKAEIIFKKD